ncbi:hydroxyphenylacetyl-CoA thioesterase PaaI [Streptomyces sp. NPDC047130]|uniref:hydroxyphenylacetyl-CoA thioesterase PaaI n=1 Tax=Streptomyces sp. NPDC047130 TaxID=3155261 RepID=UPI0033CC66B9
MTRAAQGSPGPVESMFAAAGEASARLGVELPEHGPGTAVCRMRVTRAMVDGHGTAHGGRLFLLADTACAFACACAGNSRGPVTVAAGADIDLVAPASADDVLVATARERVAFGRSGLYDVTVRRGDEVVAEFRGRSRAVGGGAGRLQHPRSRDDR